MDRPIDLDRDLQFPATKIDDKFPDRVLSPEMKSLGLELSEVPGNLLRARIGAF